LAQILFGQGWRDLARFAPLVVPRLHHSRELLYEDVLNGVQFADARQRACTALVLLILSARRLDFLRTSVPAASPLGRLVRPQRQSRRVSELKCHPGLRSIGLAAHLGRGYPCGSVRASASAGAGQ
jgi:hypothetical protein